MVFDRSRMQGGRQPRGELGGRVGAALQEEVDEMRTQVGQAAAAGALGIEHPRIAVPVVALRWTGDEREPLVHRSPGLREPAVRGTATLDQRHGGRHARLLGGAPHLLQLVERGAQRLLDDERDAPLDQRTANLGHPVVWAENVRQLDVRQLQQPAPIGFDRGAPQLGELAHPFGVVVGEPDDIVHLGDRRRIQRDVPVRGAENEVRARLTTTPPHRPDLWREARPSPSYAAPSWDQPEERPVG